MSIKVKNFVFGDDFLTKSLTEFKAHMKKTHGVSVKAAKEIYNEIHGNVSTVRSEVAEDKQSKLS